MGGSEVSQLGKKSIRDKFFRTTMVSVCIFSLILGHSDT
jgi:hypothetical protein